MLSVTKLRSNKFLSAVLCILVFLLSCVFIALLVLRAGNTARIIKNIDITGLFDDTDIAYYIEYQLHVLPFNNREIWFYIVEEFLMSDAVADEIGGIMVRYSRALMIGDLDYYLTADDVLGILHNLDAELSYMFDHELTDADYALFVRTLDDILDFEGLTIGGIIDEAEYFGINTTLPRLLVSSHLLWIAGLLYITSLVFIFWLHRRRIACALLIAGIPVFLSGLIYLTVGVVFSYYKEILNEALYSLTRFTDGLAYLFTVHGIVFIAAGIISIAAYFVLKRISVINDFPLEV